MKKILFLLGTAKEGRMSEKVANFVVETAKSRSDIKTYFADVKFFPQTKTLGLEKDLQEKWTKIIKEVDAIIIIAPEYNHGYPGELKLLLDSEYDNYKGKVAGICAVSNGPIGGARMVEQLRLVLVAFGIINVNACVYFSNVNDIFKNEVLIEKEKYAKKVNGLIDDILYYLK